MLLNVKIYHQDPILRHKLSSLNSRPIILITKLFNIDEREAQIHVYPEHQPLQPSNLLPTLNELQCTYIARAGALHEL
jgi:hypothetical protein